MNNSGQILFAGDLTPAPDWGQSAGLYLYSHGQIVPVVRPGDSMPGGGVLSSVSGFNNQHGLNNGGRVAFNAELESGEQGVYVWSQGSIHLVAKTGSVLPEIGTIDLVSFMEGFFHESFLGAGVSMNDHGQILFSAVLTDGKGVLLVASPKP